MVYVGISISTVEPGMLFLLMRYDVSDDPTAPTEITRGFKQSLIVRVMVLN